MEETLRDMRQSAQAVDMIKPVKFQVHKNGTMTIEDDQGFPALRGFPSFPASAIKAGAKWTAPASRALDPLYQGNPVIVPFTAEYEYQGIENYRDIPVHRITARYNTRYQGRPAQTKTRLEEEPLRDPRAEGFSVQGSHSVDILLRVSDGLLLLMRDNLDETVSFFDGSTLRSRGFTLTFGQGIMPINQPGTIVALEKSLGIEKKPVEKTPPGDVPDLRPDPKPAPRPDPGPDIEVSSVPEGIRLRVKNIRFAADSDVFLPEENSRLDKIAQALTQIPDRMILVEGHTASTGRRAGEMELSVQRAKRMISELVNRGVRVDRFIYKGWGGEKPMADNATEEGRVLNRRVEITILE
jgi:outer membrane protein OmpA-like peptidoglycan-associated protein